MKLKESVDFATMDVDDFMENFEADSGGEAEEPSEPVKKLKKKKNLTSSAALKKKKVKTVEEPKQEEPVEDEADSSSSEEEELDEQSHKEALEKLKDTDPEFYQYLEQNDKKLLKFGAEMDDDASSSEDEEVQEKPGELEVASDESDFEDDEKKEVGENVVTLKLLKQWQADLSIEKPKIESLRSVASAFNSALLSISGDSNKTGAYIVEGSAVFNGILQLCILHFQGALKKFLGVDVATRNIQKCKKFKKVSNMLRVYLMDVANLLDNVTSANILTVLLKHLHQLSPVLQVRGSYV